MTRETERDNNNQSALNNDEHNANNRKKDDSNRDWSNISNIKGLKEA